MQDSPPERGKIRPVRVLVIALLAGAAAAQAQPVLTLEQRVTLKRSPIPVMVPSYVPSGYELRDVLAGPENSLSYQLQYVQKGKQAIGMYVYFISGSDRDSWRTSPPSGKGVKSYAVKHSSLGSTKLWFIPEKMRGGPLGLFPLFKGKGKAFYNLEGNLEPKDAIKVLESLKPLP